MRAALADRANRPALARKMEREFDDLAQGVAGLRTELDTPQLQGCERCPRPPPRIRGRRTRRSARPTWMRWPVCRTTGAGPRPKEWLTETFEGRLAKHTGIVHERLLAEADAKVGAQLSGLTWGFVYHRW